MKKFTIGFIILIVMSALLISCGTVPSKDMNSINFLEWLNSMTGKINETNLNEKKMQKLFENEIIKKKQLVVFKKDNSINFHTKKDKVSDFLYTTDNDTMILARPVYIRDEMNHMFISFDNENWILFDMPGKYSNFKVDYNIESKLNDANDVLDIYMTSAVSVKDNVKLVKFNKKKPIMELKENMIFDSKTMRKSPLLKERKKYTLLLPANTEFTGNVLINGNIFETKREADAYIITAKRDIYLYFNKNFSNISFDRNKWNFSLLKIKFDFDNFVKSLDNKNIVFALNINLNYKDK